MAGDIPDELRARAREAALKTAYRYGTQGFDAVDIIADAVLRALVPHIEAVAREARASALEEASRDMLHGSDRDHLRVLARAARGGT